MSITVSTAGRSFRAHAYLIPVTSQEVAKKLHDDAAHCIDQFDVVAKDFFGSLGFKGEIGQSCVHSAGKTVFAFVGLGKLEKGADDNRETLRRALGVGYSLLAATKQEEVGIVLPEIKPFGATRAAVIEQITTVLHLASYRFVEFKKDKKVWEPHFHLIGASASDDAAIAAGNVLGSALNVTRSLADTPPNHMTPEILAGRAHDLAKENGLTYTVFGQEDARKMGMGCYYSVAKGSVNEGKFVVLEYAPKKKDVPTIALVGKGVCFDTGGISLKPSNYMSGMKYDMSGAAAVYGVMQAVAQLKLDARVIGVTPLVENMPSDRASKQDDVVTALNGLTVEIENTDAEGRLILSDAMTYVQNEYKPSIMIDIATLTGACMHALGHFFIGMMTRDEKLATQLDNLGKHVGDRVWRLPLTDDYKPALESVVADVANCGTPVYKAGATTAALFLEHFVEEKTRWVHLDIAGTDSKIPGTTYLGKGATGTSVRLLVELVRNLAS